MRIDQFNAMDATEATAALVACADVRSWAEAVVSARPYDDVDSLVDHAAELADRWTFDEVELALADHPRIGERHSGSGTSAEMSAREQSAVDGTAERLRSGNEEYERRFGRVFLVRAAGRSTDEILDQLDHRLLNDPTTERAVTRDELAEIAILRLRGLLA